MSILVTGGTGYIGSHTVVELLKAGDFENAGKLQNDIDEVIYTMCSANGNMYAVAKAALKKLSGLDLGGVRAPLLNLADGDEAVVDKTVALVEAAVANWIK